MKYNTNDRTECHTVYISSKGEVKMAGSFHEALVCREALHKQSTLTCSLSMKTEK